MFEESSSWNRIAGDRGRVIGIHLGYVPELDSHPEEEQRGVKLAVILALVAHLALFLVHLPELLAVEAPVARQRAVYVVKQIRFQPPPPRAQQQMPKKKIKKKIPIPDPTPNEPEPILLPELELPEVVSSESEFYGIPDAPAGPPITGIGPNGPYHPGGGVAAPQKIFYPSPLYPETARQARIEGVVILEAVVDSNGDVVRVKVLKGLPLGLTESAIETAKTWKYKPATRNGTPVAVYINLTIRFSLQ